MNRSRHAARVATARQLFHSAGDGYNDKLDTKRVKNRPRSSRALFQLQNPKGVQCENESGQLLINISSAH